MCLYIQLMRCLPTRLYSLAIAVFSHAGEGFAVRDRRKTGFLLAICYSKFLVSVCPQHARDAIFIQDVAPPMTVEPARHHGFLVCLASDQCSQVGRRQIFIHLDLQNEARAKRAGSFKFLRECAPPHRSLQGRLLGTTFRFDGYGVGAALSAVFLVG